MRYSGEGLKSQGQNKYCEQQVKDSGSVFTLYSTIF